MNGSAPKLNLQKLITGTQLPALPQSAIRLLELSQDPANGPSEFAVPIEADPGLTGQVLRFVNSSYFGFSREISSVKMAIILVGIRTIKNFSLWSAVFSLMPNPRCGPFELKSLWQDSLRRALFARTMARLLGVKEPEEAFAAALLQDMAVPLLAKEAPQQYATLLNARQQGHARLSSLEEETFGWSHAAAAGSMARQWNLPESFAEMIESHPAVRQLAEQPANNAEKLAVALSALLPTLADPTWVECGPFEEYYEEIAPAGHPNVPQLLEQIDREFASFAPVLKLSLPAKSLVDCYREVAAAATA
ncbi:MAG: HDOD domain-containing protein [Pirellulales bacterium]|nr:HDOD domain-containing protein [Pirellulales bacterium]